MIKKKIGVACIVLLIIITEIFCTIYKNGRLQAETKRIGALSTADSYILTPDNKVVQQFRFEDRKLHTIQLYFEKLDPNASGKLNVTVRDADANLINQWSPSIAGMEPDLFCVPLFYEENLFEKGESYYIEITLENNYASNVALKVVPGVGRNSWLEPLRINGVELDAQTAYVEMYVTYDALIRTIRQRCIIWGSIFLVAAILYLICKLISRNKSFLLKAGTRIGTILKKNYQGNYSAIICVTTVAFIVLLFYLFFEGQICTEYAITANDTDIINTTVNYWIYGIVTGISILGTLVVIYSTQKRRESKAEKTYLILSILLGLIYFILLLPPGSTNDSYTHIPTIYNEANRTLGKKDWVSVLPNVTKFAEKDNYIFKNYVLPPSDQYSTWKTPSTGAYDKVLRAFSDKSVSSEKDMDANNYMILNCNWVEYLPFYIAVLIGRIFQLNFMLILQIARLMGMMTYIFLMYKAIKWMPYGKEALMVFALTPMSLQTMVAISYDTLSVPVGILFIAWVLKAKNENYNIGRKDVFLFGVIIFVLGTSKGGTLLITLYAFFILMLIGDQKGKTFCIEHKEYIVIWSVLTIQSFLLFNTNSLVRQANRGTNMYTFTYILLHPLEALSIILRSIINDCNLLTQGLFGGRLGWNEEIIPWIVVVANMLIFVSACTMIETSKKSKSEIGACIVTLLCYTLGMYLIFLMGNQRNTKLVIAGMQGRYFIPLIPIAICLLKDLKVKWKWKASTLIYNLWFLALINVFFALKVYIRR